MVQLDTLQCVVEDIAALSHRQPTSEKDTPMPRAKPKSTLGKFVARRCGACHEDFVTHKPKATRCPDCIAAGLKVKYRKCGECKTPFILFDEANMNCPDCAEALGLDQSELSPEQLERLREEERLRAFIKQRDNQINWLAQRDKARPVRADNRPQSYDLISLGLI